MRAAKSAERFDLSGTRKHAGWLSGVLFAQVPGEKWKGGGRRRGTDYDERGRRRHRPHAIVLRL